MIQRSEQCGKDVLKHAKDERASKKRSADGDLNAACLEGAGFYCRRPVTFFGKGNDYKRKVNMCCVCGTRGGTFFINDGKAFCREHKQAMYLPGKELAKVIEKERGALC